MVSQMFSPSSLGLPIVSQWFSRLSSTTLSCLQNVAFHLSSTCLPAVSQLSSTCRPVVVQMWSPCHKCLPDVTQMRFPRCCLPVASKVSPLVVSVSQMSPRYGPLIVWYPNCLPELSSTVPSCLPELVLQLSRSVFHVFPSCLSDVVSHLSPNRPAFVFQMWCPDCLRNVVHLYPTTPSCIARCGLPNVSQLCHP